ncbi:MAG TPA: hypothetical protein VIM31_03730 [Candidatus Microsaccharimonas sp.]|jgi:hypothetical protein
MDEGPFRAPQPAERRVPSRQETASRQQQAAEKPEPVKEAPKPTYRSERAEIPAFDEPKKRRSLKKILLPIIILIVILAIGFFGWSAWSKSHATAMTGIDSSKYQAIFFTNGQVYFGKLQSFNDNYMKLTDIFYLQTQSSTSTTGSTNPQTSSSDTSNVQLIKLGSEVHGPEDAMMIAKDQVLFYENLKADGKVAQSIDKYVAK